MDLVLDGGGSLMPGDAAFVATALERFHVMWFDEPTSVLTSDGLAKITDESVMPIGLGRNDPRHRVFPESAPMGLHRPASPERWAEQLGRRSAVWPRLRKLTMSPSRRITMVARSALSPPYTWQPAFQIHTFSRFPSRHQEDAAMRAELTSGNSESADGLVLRGC